MMKDAWIRIVVLVGFATTIASGFQVNTSPLLGNTASSCRSFQSTDQAVGCHCSSSLRRNRRPFVSVALSAEVDESKENTISSSVSSDSVQVPKVVEQQATSVPQEEPAKYPINVPSPILLAVSMLLAIASTGSLFELLGGDPLLGTVATTAVAVIGFPSCLFLFYASILKATAETEEDDKEFLGKN